MKLAPISFTGLWINKGVNNNISSYEYRPFSDESIKDAQKIVDEYNGKTRLYYVDDDDYQGESTKIDAKLGKTLNITLAEYQAHLPAGPRQTHDSDDTVYIQ